MTSTLAGVRAGAFAMLAALLVTGAPVCSAEMIGAEQVAPAQGQAQVDRAKVQEFLDRANVREKLQAMGVTGLAARDRVGAMSEEEVHALAQRIDSLPAGGALSQSDWILILLVSILVILVL
jgi:hypothetical protein